MKLQLCLVFLFLSLKGSYSMITSYPSPGNGLSFLCGCASRSQYNTSIQMKCRDEQIIHLEPDGYVMRDSVGNSNDCGKLNSAGCRSFFPNSLDPRDQKEVYKKCSFKNSCDIKIAGVEEEGKQRLMRYPFDCQAVKPIHDISVKKDITQYIPTFYFSGENHTGRKIDCDCLVTGPNTITLEIYFIHLKPTSCSKVKFLYGGIQLFGCFDDDTIMLHVKYYKIGTEFKLEIRDMEPDKEDVLFFRLWGSSVSVNCTGCTKSKDNRSTTTATSSMDTTVDTEHPSNSPSTTGLPATVPLTTDLLNTDVPVTTDSATGRALSTGNTDHSSNDNYPALLGGVIAAIMVINIVGIGIYCFIRKRKKPNNVPNEPIPPVVSSNDYADFHHPIGTDHHYQELMDYQNVTRQDTPTEPESH